MLGGYKKVLPFVGALFVIGFFLYAFNFNNQLFWDDDDWIVNNPYVHELTWQNVKHQFSENVLAGVGLNSNYYRPLLLLSFTLNYVVHGTVPFGYHLVSNFLHIANGILLFFLTTALFRRRWIAFGTALVFLVHPLQTEAVTYISGRGDPLHVFFMLFGLLTVLRAHAAPVRSRAFWAWTGGGLVALLLALLSRETAIIFPFLAALVLATARLYAGQPLASKNLAVRILPFFLLVFLYGILRLTVLNFDNTLNFYLEPNLYSTSFPVRMYTFAGVLLSYAKILVAPVGLHMERSVSVLISFLQWPVWFVWGSLAALLYAVTRAVRTQSRHAPFLVFGAGWFFIALGPTSGITPINAQMYEHWLYLALAGPALLGIYYAEMLFRRLDGRSASKILFAGILVAYVLFFSWQTVARNIAWGKPISFYEDILMREGDSPRIATNLGLLYGRAGDIARSEEYYKRAIASGDIFPQPHYNVGNIYRDRGDAEAAEQEYLRAIELNPAFHYAYQNLGALYADQRKFREAAAAFQKLLTFRPLDMSVYYNLAVLSLIRGDAGQAAAYLRDGLDVSRGDADLREKMQTLLNEISSR